MWQTFIHVSKSKIHLQNSMHQSPGTPPMEHTRGSAEILNIARSAGPWWILTSQTLSKFSFWGNLAYHKIWPNFIFFMSMGPTLTHLKLWPQNFSEADTCTIWNYNMKSQTGQKENANVGQTFEHKPKMWNFCTKKIDPRFNQFGPDHHRVVLLFKAGLKKPSLQAILN